jgi:hypothetical protein
MIGRWIALARQRHGSISRIIIQAISLVSRSMRSHPGRIA